MMSSAPDPVAPLLPVRGRDGRFSGDLPADAARTIAARLRAGDSYDAISSGLGLGRATGRRKCAEVAAALGMPIEESRHVVFAREVAALVGEGLTDKAIAERLGRTLDSVASARKRALGTKYGVTPLTPTEHAEIDRRIINRESTRSIAAAIGCNQGTVWRRRAALADQLRADLPPCSCGKPVGHGGRCDLVIDAGLIRERLLQGMTAAEIAREFGRTAQSFKPKYVQPVIDQLTAEGHLCGCGQPFGHQFVCTTTRAAQRRRFTAEQRSGAEQLVRRGSSVRAVRESLGITTNSARMLVKESREALAQQGAACPCGQPIDHGHVCAARGHQNKGRTTFRFASATAASMPRALRARISKLARAGHGSKPICDKTGETGWRVDELIRELREAGLTPAKCATCENPFNHRGPCALPKRCDCGRWRNHRGPCRSAEPKKTVSNGGKPPAVEPKLYRSAMNRYRAGESIHRISEATGISWGVVQRLVAYWRRKSHYDLKPCACGRPARHPGGCIVNTPGAVGKLEQARIVEAIRAGEMPRQIAERMGIGVAAIFKHSAAARAQLFADGVTCGCGRPLHHAYWCSARWDAHEQPRGLRPFPEPQETQAVEALLRGDPASDIAAAVEVGIGSIWRLRRSLDDEQRARREKAVGERLARTGARGGEALMARVKAAVPRSLVLQVSNGDGRRSLDTSLRDDVVNELYLAVIEGRVELEQIGSVVRSFVNRGLSQWQSAFGPASLDARLAPDDARTRGEMIEDGTAAAQLEQMEIGR